MNSGKGVMDVKTTVLTSLADHQQTLLRDNKIVLSLKIISRAASAGIKGVMADGAIKIAVRAPRDRGAANRELKKILAEYFSVDSSRIKIVSGLTSTKKVIKIEI